MNYHNPVLLTESIDGLNIKSDGIYVDVTFGGGGHSKEILSRLGAKGKLYAFDQDEDALKNAIDDERFVLIHENFRFIGQFLKFYGVRKVDGILGDFGVSSHQFDVAERGFSTRFDADLDMRMSKRNTVSAYDVVNAYDYDELRRVLFQYGDLRNANAIATAIIANREAEPIKTTDQLKSGLKQFLPARVEHKILAQIYQAIRIEVNQEIEVIKEFLMQVPELLNEEGRLSVISYHSLEDRLVKNFFRSGKFEGEPDKDFYGNMNLPLKKVGGLVVPSKKEIASNNRARSAKLRIAEKAKSKK
ncbi:MULTISPECIES: 16S rRNA (cytosine(1402)-N(4))-methyltransferase RsmH [Cellulophaga]|jgi:16S rRNA (cytosine1402-N4)-methyltransferase|uniref:Ribosomal RNA small subunit methyltransferase H n=1 Tax=Cellulophaga baltica TaxID=76594 RepID=A0A1G7CRX9_9FLAO|nr:MULTISPECIES: 16S rRNA (cytosine(1402)-N(4))-methyltransferase RsmH [Cellulophaga]WFO17973.1 16S rRNA (cytosine(1402)-N(4))-methyltransferase RsmH [Cellulophaga baltica 4]AIY13219.1 16S rRNA methyltransferase [Cellulophaga baltica NN016038]KGK31771.1 16S rRNA methyltransferase [Cellulophaga sp. E6(2014)]MCR1023812.1 16S rRNA (cytosine(1402)-N(4))-methyltransferase RsmH [Cellulophaga baltica]SDE41520.1 16S rRNA (cytosine1402-N4)-methyltransferase [Cellulophaga baltica]